MQNQKQAMLASLLITLGVSALAGLIAGSLAWGCVIGLLGWALLQVRRFNRLCTWLNLEDDSEPPESNGHWGNLYDDLARLQRRHRQRERQLRAIITRFQQSSAALSDAIVIIDNQNNLEWWNRAADRLLGLQASSDRGKPVMNMLRDPRFIRYFKKGQYQDPLQLPSPINSDVSLLYQITKFGEGDRLLVARDITRLRRLEQTRQDFVANASHELRTPLTVIRGYLETFLEHELPRPLFRGLTQMQLQARRMESLVADLLLLSRLEASDHISDEQPVQIHSMLRRIREDALALGKTQEKQHTIEIDAAPQYDLLGQESELHSAFSNLVFNAVRYTPDAGHITLRWFTDEQGAGMQVQDNGPGIDSVHIPRLTERFYRVDESRSTASGGTGLGLAIVKHVLARHGAQLEIQSVLQEGSTFTCRFPPEMIIEHHDGSDDTSPGGTIRRGGLKNLIPPAQPREALS